ncbi:MAG: nucleotide exchange factor GrpE [Clostridiales bacterium]|nr:nucleotide exchange factor GrpE [Clostridiales bacterium]
MAKKKNVSEDIKEEVLETEETTEETTEEIIEEAVEAEEVTESPEFSEVDKLKNECAEINDKFIRLQAEFLNFKKRTEKEKSNLYKFANEKLFVDLLPLMDNMERALASTENGSDGIIDGLKMIKKSLDELFIKNDVHPIEAIGQEFDPELHHAVMSDESDDHEAEHVIEEFQKGYKLNDKVIRHSMVKVSK